MAADRLRGSARRARAVPRVTPPDAGLAALRRAVLDTAQEMSRRGLSPGRSGNVSARVPGGGMLITPTGLAYDSLTPADIVHVADDGAVAPGQRAPSSEWAFHLAAYRARPEAHAVVHTHSMHATVLACAGRPIPAFHYMVLAAGGRDIPVVPYATFGTEELARVVGEGLRQRKAVLMANHGAIATGATLAAALELASEVEVLAEQYVKVLAIGGPRLLTDEQLAAAEARFQTYGQRKG